MGILTTRCAWNHPHERVKLTTPHTRQPRTGVRHDMGGGKPSTCFASPLLQNTLNMEHQARFKTKTKRPSCKAYLRASSGTSRNTHVPIKHKQLLLRTNAASFCLFCLFLLFALRARAEPRWEQSWNRARRSIDVDTTQGDRRCTRHAMMRTWLHEPCKRSKCALSTEYRAPKPAPINTQSHRRTDWASRRSVVGDCAWRCAH